MDLDIDIKEEPVWHEGVTNTSPVSNLPLPTADKLAEVKFEPQEVFAIQILEGTGASLVKEDNEIKDVKKEIKNEAGNTHEDTVHEVENPAKLAGGSKYSCVNCEL
ncbi:uncharacterized protein [Anabrus simplex]|uniref:uncharacterized protein isoform X2 n=1 Tax=Anabrus simplex TaxID=316456 RepID=UPI0035A2E88E